MDVRDYPLLFWGCISVISVIGIMLILNFILYQIAYTVGSGYEAGKKKANEKEE